MNKCPIIREGNEECKKMDCAWFIGTSSTTGATMGECAVKQMATVIRQQNNK